MKSLKKIAGFNLLAILVYSAIIRLVAGGQSEGDMGILIMSAFAVGLHVVVCLIVSAIEYGGISKEIGKAWLASAGIVLVVGFSVCLGNTSL